MKRDLQKLIAFLAMLFLPFALFAQYVDAAYGIRIDESFEKGIPAGWTQENVSGSVNWVAETQNLTYPNGASDSLARIAFRNTTGVTNKAVTRLVLPAVDVSLLFQPILIFSHAQEKWSGDFDSLRVLCRTSADGEWKTLTAYDNYIAKWQRDTVFLPSAAYCQIAFEATDNLGRGVVIDDVVVRSTPSCFKPEDLFTSNIKNNSVTINWLGSFDAEYFYVKLSKTQLTADELESATTELVCDTTTDGISIDFEGLIQGSKYYCYVRSQCEHEISDWVSLEFKTSNLVNIPYFTDFEVPNVADRKNQPAYMDGWFYAASDEKYKPYLNSYCTDLKNASSSDASNTLVFAFYLSSSTGLPTYSSAAYLGALPEGIWAYAATPEINGNLKDLQVTFESFRQYDYPADQYSIIVGVMTDPEDRSTFVPIKTITNTRQFICEEYTVSFEEYTGDGKYIAFMSDFAKTNHFNVENLVIEPRKEVPTLQYDILMPTASTLQFKFEQTCDSYEVILTSSEYDIDRNSDFPDSLSVISKHTIQNMGSVEGLIPDSRYNVYARGVKGTAKGKWSLPVKVEMPSRLDANTLPYILDFENIATVSSYDMNGCKTTGSIPKIIKPLYTYATNAYALSDSVQWTTAAIPVVLPLSKTEFVIGAEPEYDAVTIAVFPEVDMSSTKVSFYAARRYPKGVNPATTTNKQYSKAYIGVMTEANNFDSFVAVDTIEPGYDYNYYEYDFTMYPEVKGNFFAIKMENYGIVYDKNKRTSNRTNRIFVDNIVFAKSLSNCKAPNDIEAEVNVYDPSKATITWKANGVTEWNIRVAATEYDKNQFGESDNLEFIFDGKVTKPKLELAGLKYPYQKYYYWLQPICNSVAADWTTTRFFETFCPAVHSVPYSQNFDDAEAGSNVWSGFAVSCMTTKQWTRNIPGATPSSFYKNKYYYPYVTKTHAYSGDNSLPIFKKYSNTSRNYVALPELDRPIDSLQLSFRLYSEKNSSSFWSQQELAVGVMSDPMNISTFEQVAVIVPSKHATWERVAVKFDGYRGHGKYIAIRETDKYTSAPSYSTEYVGGRNTDSVYIDDIEVNLASPCDIPYDIIVSDVTPNSAKLTWNSDAESFVVVVSDKILTYVDLLDFDDYKAGALSDYAHTASIAFVDTVEGSKTVNITGLTVNKDYYVYVKGFCQGMYTDYAVDYTFSTFCPQVSPEVFYADFSDVKANEIPDCWFVGKISGEYYGTNTIKNYARVSENAIYGKTLHLTSTDGSLNVYNQPQPNGIYAVTPNLDIDDISKYKIKFEAATTEYYMYSGCGSNDYAHSIIVGVVTNPYDMSTFMPIDTIDVYRNLWPYEVYFDKYICDLNGDKGKFVAFYSSFNVRNDVYIDNVHFELIDDCVRFEAKVESSTTSSITLKFKAVPASYEVKVADKIVKNLSQLDNDTLNLYPSTMGTTDAITIEGLKAHTEYFFYVRSTADTTCQDWKLVLSAYPADYKERDLPFFDGFESNKLAATYGACPHDWYGFYVEGNKSYPTVSSSNIKTGTRSVQVNAYTGISNYLVTPKLNVDKLADCYLLCNIYASVNSTYPNLVRAIMVGAVSDPNNIEATFEPIDTFLLAQNQMGKWLDYRLILSDYKGTAKHIAFLSDGPFNVSLGSANANLGAFFIDNVSIDYIPNCFAPYTFVEENITDHSIELSFIHGGAMKYEAMYDFTGLISDPTSDSLSVSAKVISFTDLNFTIDSLYSEKSYDVYVRAICSEKDTSNWALAGTYTTLPALITSYPYNDDFEDVIENANWKTRGSAGSWYAGVDSEGLVADKKNMTDKALYYSYDKGVSPTHNAATSSMIYRYLELKTGTYEVSYDWVVPGEVYMTSSQTSYRSYLRAMLVPVTAKFGTSANSLIAADGSSFSLDSYNLFGKTYPKGFVEVAGVTEYGPYHRFAGLYGTDLTLPLENQWQRHSQKVVITEETEGTYMLIFYYKGYGDGTTKGAEYRSAVIDNLSITKNECAFAFDLKVDSYTTNSATLSWSTSDSIGASYDVVVLNADVNPTTATESQKVFTSSATTNSISITGLQPFTTYYAYVRQVCSSADNSWGDPIEFTTDVTLPEGYTFSFEEDNLLYYPKYTNEYVAEYVGDKTYRNTTSLFHKWLSLSMVESNNTMPATYNYSKSYGSYYPQVVRDTTYSNYKLQYARTGKRALWFGSRTTNAFMNGATIALPYVGEFDGKRLIFYMRAFCGRMAKTSTDMTTEVAATYYPYTTSGAALNSQSRKITIGTMTDPNDATTFVAIDTVEYSYTNNDYATGNKFTVKDPAGDKGWVRAVVSLKDAKGKYIAFRYEHHGTTSAEKSLNMYIDDVTIETIPMCPSPEQIEVTSVKESSVSVDYKYDGVPTTAVVVASDENFMNVVLRDTFNTLPFTVTGLNPLTKYYLKANVVCSDLDASAYSRVLEFSTPLAICYDNDFDKESAHYPQNWEHAYGPALHDVDRGYTQVQNGHFGVPTIGAIRGWSIKPALFADGKFSSRHLVGSMLMQSGTSSMWAISPLLELDETADQHLSFDLAVTERATNNPFDFTAIAGDTSTVFAVLITEGEGYPYESENLTVWKMKGSNLKYGYYFDEILHRGAEYSIDLNKYKGKNIQVLFYFYASVNMDIHVDNVHINRYATKEYNASACEFCDFEDNDFFVLSSNTQLGENKFSKWQLNSENSDTLLVLNLNVTDAPETDVDATICAGDVYSDKGFTGLMNKGVYRQKFVSKNGCDSIVTLALNVVEPQHTTIIDTVCFGTTYTFAGQELNRTGMYVDSLISKVTGCDSIVTLLLTVKDVLRTDAYVNICFGDTYKFGKQTISASGTYEEMFKTVDGCDSLVTLHATMLPDYRQTINAVIKKGEEYNASGFVGLTTAGEYTLPLKSVDGCDSTVTLILKVLSDVSKEVSVNICFGESYTFGTQTITKSGEYVEVFKAADGGDSTVILTATVLPDLRQTIEATICAGEVYNENGFSNLKESGEYKLPLTSVDGCDSTVTLNLTVLSGDTTYIEKSITTRELPYEYQTIKYDKSTLPGTYIDTIVVKTGNCEEVIIHKLTITPTVDVDNASTRDLIMVPNPVAVNGTLYINAEFTTDERNGLIVEVFNAIGQCVYSDRPTVYPIEVSGLAERGMYIVRIITGDGKSYQGKIIVE